MQKKIRKTYSIIAICYDFDKTLSPRSMQEDAIFKEYGIDANRFWDEVGRAVKDQGYDGTLCYLNKLIFDPEFKKKPLIERKLSAMAQKVRYCPGVKSFFPRINRFMDKEAKHAGLDVSLEHYIISGGLKAILDHMSIRKHFKEVYACEYEYGKNKAPKGVKTVINDTMKTQCLFRISKGKLGLREDVNELVEKGIFRIPFAHMIYIGDGDSDIPSMAVVKKYGGYAVAVYSPEKEAKRKSLEIFRIGRAGYVAEADYTEGSALDKIIKTIIKDIIQKMDRKPSAEIVCRRYSNG